MKQSSKRLFTLIIALVLFVAAFVIYFNFVVPEYTATEQIKSDVASNENFVANEKTVIEQVKRLINESQGQESLRQTINIALPISPEQSDVIHELNSLATLSRLSPQSFVVSAPPIRASSNVTSTNALVRPVGSLSIQMKLLGSYNDFKAFLKNLDTNLRIFDARALVIDPAGKPGQDIFSYDLTVGAYYQTK